MSLNCPHCGHVNFDDAKVCRRCRKDISNRCPECGAHRPPSATFCTKCGTIYRVKINTDAYRQRPADAAPSETSAEIAARGVVPVHQATRELKKCPECFHKVDAQAPFCIYCGYMFDIPSAHPEPEEPHPAPEPAPPPKPAAPRPASVAPKPAVAEPPATGAKATPPRPGAPVAPKAAPKPAPKAAAEAEQAKSEAAAPPRPKPAAKAPTDAAAAKVPPRPVPRATPEPVAENTPKDAPPIPPRPRPADIPTDIPTEVPAAEKSINVEIEESEPPSPAAEPAAPPEESEAKTESKPEAAEEQPIFFHDKINPYLNVDVGEADVSEIPGIVPLSEEPRHTPLTEVPEGAGFETVGGVDGMVPVNGEEGGPTAFAPFLIDRYPVTNEDYRRFVEATGVAAPPDWKDGRCIHGMDRYPVTSINFEQARAYARWAGKRIPTAREWERAAGGDRGLRFPWGDDVEPRRAHFDVARNCLEPVDAHPDGVSPAGCWDMMGNAAEWTLDFKLSEPILKGGSYLDDPGIIDTKTCCRTAPDRLSPLVGFRCARDAS